MSEHTADCLKSETLPEPIQHLPIPPNHGFGFGETRESVRTKACALFAHVQELIATERKLSGKTA